VIYLYTFLGVVYVFCSEIQYNTIFVLTGRGLTLVAMQITRWETMLFNPRLDELPHRGFTYPYRMLNSTKNLSDMCY
jgi:hypothetical protein